MSVRAWVDEAFNREMHLTFRRFWTCLLPLLFVPAALAIPALSRAQGAEQPMKQEYFVQQSADEDLLITVNAFEAELESRVSGANGELLLLSGISGSRIVPLFQYIYAPSKNRQIGIEVIANLHTGRTEFGIELTRLKAWDSRSSSVSKAYRLLSFGTEIDAADSQANWTVKIDSLANAGRLFEQYGMREMRLWANYLAAHMVLFHLHDNSIVYSMTQDILSELKGSRLQKIELATLQLQAVALIGLRKSGMLNTSAGNPDPVQDVLRRAAELAQAMGYDFEQARALYASGLEYAEQSSYTQALDQYQLAVKLADAIGSVEMAKSIRDSIVQVHTLRGDAPATSEVLQEIESQLVEEGGGDELALNLLAQARLLSGAYHFQRALEVLSGALSYQNNSAIRRQINFELAKNLYETGHLDEALMYFRLADINPESKRRIRGRPVVDIGEGLGIMANIYRYKGEFQLMQSSRDGQGNYQHAADRYFYAQGLDAAARAGGKGQQAASYFLRSFEAAGASGHADLRHLANLQYCLQSGSTDGPCAQTSLDAAYEWLLASGVPRLAAEAMSARARLLARNGRRSEALAVMERLVDEIHMLRQSLPGVLGAWYWERHEAVFDAWLGMLVGDTVEQGSADGSAALLALSKMRLIEGYAQSSSAAKAGGDASDPLRALLAERTHADTKQAALALSEKIRAGLDTLRVAHRRNFEFLSDAGLKQYLRGLGHDESVLTFHLGPDMAQVWVGNSDGVVRKSLANPAQLYRKLLAARQDLPFVGLDAFDARMDELGRLLAEPVSNLLTDTVYCITAGPLLGFPLDALRLDGHYLVERHAFVHLLDFPQNDTPSKSLQSGPLQQVFLAGNPQDYAGDYATRLETSPGISAVADLFVGPGLQIIQGVALLPDEFKGSFYAQADLVHLAMPGLVNLKYPEDSGLELSESEYEPGRVILMAPDIRAQKLDARLVFLASTRTTEKPRTNFSSKPGLVADFLAAGAGSVIVNNWAGDSGSDSRFITGFYRALEDTGNIAGALRRARLAYLKNSRDNGIYDWAGYQLYIR